MVMGGIPYYLDMLDRNKTFSQNIDSLFFDHGAPLRTEYDFLFQSLFRSSAIYRQVVEAISSKSKGLSLKEIKEALGDIRDGGGSTIFANVISSDAIMPLARRNGTHCISSQTCFPFSTRSSYAGKRDSTDISGQTSKMPSITLGLAMHSSKSVCTIFHRFEAVWASPGY